VPVGNVRRPQFLQGDGTKVRNDLPRAQFFVPFNGFASQAVRAVEPRAQMLGDC
jgi:hypothetical protein